MTFATLFFCIAAIGAVAGSFTASVASAKGYSMNAWFVGGFFFSIFALIAIAGMPPVEEQHKPVHPSKKP